MTGKRIQRGKNHSYTIDGEKADGVTTIIGKGCPKPALVGWASKVVAEHVASMDADSFADMKDEFGTDGMVKILKGLPNKLRDEAADRGKRVHTYAEKMLDGRPVDHLVAEGPYVEAVAMFIEQWKPKVLLQETPVFSRRWKYAGQFDFIADLPDGRRVLFDWKTTGSGIWPETAMQLAAYRNADFYIGTDGVTEVPMSEIGIDECMAVWLRPGAYSVIPVDTSEAVFRAFLHVQYVARVTDTFKQWVHPEVSAA